MMRPMLSKCPFAFHSLDAAAFLFSERDGSPRRASSRV